MESRTRFWIALVEAVRCCVRLYRGSPLRILTGPVMEQYDRLLLKIASFNLI
jgi:hypothetical protein